MQISRHIGLSPDYSECLRGSESDFSSCRVQQRLQQPSLCLQGSPHYISSSPAKVKSPPSIWPDREGPLHTSFVLNPFNSLAGQLLQVVRAANGTQYIIQQPQQQILLQQQMQPAGVQAPVIQQVRRVL